jgi:cytochrome P450
MRNSTRDFENSGQRIRAGDRVVMLYASANRDEDVFRDPDRFDVGRDPNPHLSFGFGEHFCVGAALARLEARIFLEEWLALGLVAEPAGPVRRLRSNLVNGVKSAPIRLRAP